jgi:NitT/TauT family transport system permease protein
MFAALVLVSLVGIAIYFIFDLLASRLLGRWHDSELPGR